MALATGDTIPAAAETQHPALAYLAAQRGVRPSVLFLLRAFT